MSPAQVLMCIVLHVLLKSSFWCCRVHFECCLFAQVGVIVDKHRRNISSQTTFPVANDVCRDQGSASGFCLKKDVHYMGFKVAYALSIFPEALNFVYGWERFSLHHWEVGGVDLSVRSKTPAYFQGRWGHRIGLLVWWFGHRWKWGRQIVLTVLISAQLRMQHWLLFAAGGGLDRGFGDAHRCWWPGQGEMCVALVRFAFWCVCRVCVHMCVYVRLFRLYMLSFDVFRYFPAGICLR